MRVYKVTSKIDGKPTGKYFISFKKMATKETIKRYVEYTTINSNFVIEGNYKDYFDVKFLDRSLKVKSTLTIQPLMASKYNF